MLAPALPLTIAIDARAAAEVPAGRGRVVRELLAALRDRDEDHRYELLCREPGPVEGGLDERFSWVPIARPDPLWHVLAARHANRHADVLLSTNSYLTAWFTRVPTAVVVYDLVAFVPGGTVQKRSGRIERATIRPALRRAATLLCISQATERDLVERFPAAGGKTEVFSMGVDPRFSAARAPAALAAARERHGLPERFVLGVGTLEPRKNLVRLIDAWSSLDEGARGGAAMALVGPRGWEVDEIEARAGAAGVRTLGFVEDDDLAALYAACTAFAFPSVYEGFGLPVLEAMRRGVPVACSNRSSLPEVAGDAALMFDPDSPREAADAIERILGDPAEAELMRAAGRAQAERFSWQAAARATVASYERALRS